MAHLLNRLQFEVRCYDEELAFNLRHNFALTFQEQIAEAIDAICSKYVNDEEWLQIDRLEIDMGHFTPSGFDNNFAALFQSKFEQAFTQKLSGISPVHRKASRQLSRVTLFQHFMLHGTLPWWADATSINLDEISMDLLQLQPEALKQFFTRHRFTARVWKRASMQLNDASRSRIISLLEELTDARATISAWLELLLQFMKEDLGLEFSLQESYIDAVVLREAVTVFRLPHDSAMLLQLLQENMRQIISAHQEPALQTLNRHLARFHHQEEDRAGLLPRPASMGYTALEPGTAAATTGEADRIIPEEDREEEEKYFVKHSGIVLLAPFLRPFFTNLHLLDDTAMWQSKAAQYKAVHLLKFLSTGVQKIPEYHLILEKVICGIAIHEPIPIETDLEEDEIKEGENLLRSVIDHWKVLKHTSINGLRESFLKRDGLLIKQDEGWCLQVERKTLDILIDSIPWGYSTHALPWNDILLFVEW